MQRVGRERLMAEAVESHIAAGSGTPPRVARPARGAPEFDFELPDSEEQDWQFTATVAVQAKPELADWTKLEVGANEPEVRRS